LSNPPSNCDTVTGYFTIDQTNATLENFSFVVPGYTLDSNFDFGSLSQLVATVADSNIVVIDAIYDPGFGGGITVDLSLAFATDLLTFSGNTFYTGLFSNDIEEGISLAHCGEPDFCPVIYASTFASGFATPVPEPSTWAMLTFGFFGLGFLGWTCPAFAESVFKFTRPASRTEAG